MTEIIQWALHAVNVIETIMGLIGKAKDTIPDEYKQKLPKLFGLTLDDERIFNSVLADLTLPERTIIGKFLHRCKDYERNRFINIVAGMEVTPAKPKETQTKFDKAGKKESETVKDASPGCDCRKKFLESFVELIETQYSGDLDKAYEYCVSGRMILADPVHQKVLRVFSDSVSLFKRIVLLPFGAKSMEEMANNARTSGTTGMREINGNMRTLVERAKNWRDQK